ncbi:peptidase M15 [Pontibacillus chungwhensis BH030062]|uniref:Peptidase M15 n=1 Tax=Pontibacillus chungwhensis BH030062 TaxID=1385513 RepID=A0A0A2UP06_9BACI|nr:M15 family metallopeptidase [Pontibacillus chungwhensis]KGP90012.1 peptidase M15 [Pontibacillus chungwhensis BH030062]
MRRIFLIGFVSMLALAACQSSTDETQQAKENASKNTAVTKKENRSEEQDQENSDDSQQDEDQDQISKENESNEEKNNDSEPNEDSDSEEQSMNQEDSNQEESSESSAKVVDNPTSIEVVVNKQRKLPDGYTPPDLTVPQVPFYFDEFHQKKQMREVAASALEELFEGADQAGIDLVAASGYRAYERQEAIFASNVEKHGEEHARQFSAVPGHSEHQTGLAMDVTVAKLSFQLSQDLGDMKEGEWLAENAHNYGFVIRYPEGKTDITGYEYEPWHLRYVGKDVATKVYNQDATLEEFYNLVP